MDIALLLGILLIGLGWVYIKVLSQVEAFKEPGCTYHTWENMETYFRCQVCGLCQALSQPIKFKDKQDRD